LDDYVPEVQFAPGRPGTSVGPNIGGNVVTRAIAIPPVRLYRFRNVSVSSRATAFASTAGVVVERAPVADPERCVSIGGYLVSERPHVATIEPRPRTDVEHGFFLSGYGYFNFYHWLIEILPKLHYWQSLPDELRSYPFLIGEDVCHTEQLMEALRYWTEDPAVVMLENDRTYVVGNLLHINAPNSLPFNLQEGQESRVEDSLLRPETVSAWRDRVGLGDRLIDRGGPRLFLAREGVRRSYNQDEVLEIFAGAGFQAVHLEHLTLAEQIELMASAEFIAGPTGAAWAHLVFCSRGTRALCWMAEQSRGFSSYANLAHATGVDLRYVTHPTEARSTGELYSANYQLDPGSIRRALRDLLEGTE
jgi:hypothetical protein